MRGETVTVRRPGSMTDSYNNALPDWQNTTDHDEPGCAVSPSSSSEENAGRAAVIVGLALHAPAGADILSTDRVVVRGDTYEVDGEVGDWRSPFSGVAKGIEVALKRVSG